MKGVFIVVCCLLCLGAREEGIVSDEGTFNEALANTTREGKMVFVNCHTSWRRACKRMASRVSPMVEAGEAMNGHPGCLMRDMEKGEGALCHKFAGATGPKMSVTRVEAAMNPGKAMGPPEKRHEAGERDKEMLTLYAEMLKGCNDTQLPEVIRELFTQLTDEERLSEKYRYIYGRVDYFPVGSEHGISWRTKWNKNYNL